MTVREIANDMWSYLSYRGTAKDKFFGQEVYIDKPAREKYLKLLQSKFINPACYLCHRHFTSVDRRPIRARLGKNLVLVCDICARKIANPKEVGLFTPSRTLRKPTKAQIERWKKMPDFFSEVTEKDREEAWKRGCII